MSPENNLNGTEKKEDVQFLQDRWSNLETHLKEKFDKTPKLEGILFLIGVRELGKGADKFTKEQKQDLIHIGICAVLAKSGYYQLSHQDQDGWPHWESVKTLPYVNIFEQELFLKSHILDYFSDVWDV